MAITPYPLPRETRESAILVGNGTVGPYGPSTFKVFDTIDVIVLAKADGEEFFSDVTSVATVDKTAGLAYDTFSILFDDAVPVTTQFYYAARRTAERTAAVTKAGTIDSLQLEKELSKQATVLSELRRDIDNGLQLPPATGGRQMELLAEGHIWKADASGNMVDGGSADDIADAQEHAAEATAALAALREIYIGAFASDALANAAFPARPIGARYFNTVTNSDRVWSGAAWVAAPDVPDGSVTDVKLAAPSKANLWNATKVSARYFGVNPAADVTTVLQNLLQRNDVPEEVVFAPGDYGHMEVQITGANLRLDTTLARFYQLAATAGSNRLWRFMPGSEGTRVRGRLLLDGNRDALAGSWVYDTFNGWVGLSIECANIGIEELALEQWLDYPCFLWGNETRIGHIAGYRNAGAILIGPRDFMWDESNGAKIEDLYIGSIHTKGTADQGALGQYQHAITSFTLNGGQIGSILMEDQGGDVGASAWISGLTLNGCKDLQLGPCRYMNPLADAKFHLPFTLVGLQNSQIDRLYAYNFAGQGLEMDTLEGCQIGQVHLDGNYHATTAVPVGSDQNVGVLEYSFGHYPNARRASAAGCRNTHINDILVERMTSFGTLKTQGVTWDSIRCRGMLKDGANFLAQDSTGFFPDGYTNTHSASHIGYYSARGCGKRAMLVGGEGGTVSIGYIDLCDNGQDSTQSIENRTAIAAGGAVAANQNLRIMAGEVTDKQNYTVVQGVSWKSGAADANNRYVFTCFETDKLDVGYNIKLINVNGFDRIGRVVHKERDEITLEFTTPQSLLAASNLVALSGTWTQAGTTLTGVGGNAIVELDGRPAWLTDGAGNYGQVGDVTGANTMLMYEAFPALAPGASLSMVLADFSGIPSQQRGLRAFGQINEIFLGEAIKWDGNVVDPMLLSDVSKVAPGSYYRRRVTLTPAASTNNLLSSIPRGHRLVAYQANNDAAFTGIATMDIRLTNSAGTLIRTVHSITAFTKNAKVGGVFADDSISADGNLVRLVADTIPTTGTITFDALFHVVSIPALPNAP